MGRGVSEMEGRRVLRYLLYLGLAAESGRGSPSVPLLPPRSVLGWRPLSGVQTDEFSSPPAPLEAVGHLTVVGVSALQEVGSLGSVCPCGVCPQTSGGPGTTLGMVSSRLGSCGQSWEEPRLQVWPWAWEESAVCPVF